LPTTFAREDFINFQKYRYFWSFLGRTLAASSSNNAQRTKFYFFIQEQFESRYSGRDFI